MVIYIKFTEEGCHSTLRSDRYWPGIWIDLVKELLKVEEVSQEEGELVKK